VSGRTQGKTSLATLVDITANNRSEDFPEFEAGLLITTAQGSAKKATTTSLHTSLDMLVSAT
jgi:hypothetical protein